MLEDAIRNEPARPATDNESWVVAGVLTNLEAAVLTTLCAEAALAGTLELNDMLYNAANDAHAPKEP